MVVDDTPGNLFRSFIREMNRILRIALEVQRAREEKI